MGGGPTPIAGRSVSPVRSAPAAPLRVVQWTTRNAARQTVRAVLARPDLHLVGASVGSEAKIGADLAELCDLPRSTGVVATNDAGALVGLKPDCIIYTPLHPRVDELITMLGHGVNVVTSSEFLTGSRVAPADRGATMDDLGWGRPDRDRTHRADVERSTAVFAEGVEVLARICGLDVRWEALIGDQPVIECRQRWVMCRSLRPAWTVEHGYVVEISGDPNIKVKLDIWPDTDDLAALTTRDIYDIGMRITGVPLVNAIRSVCAAAPGIPTYADLPVVSTRLVPPSRT